MNRTVRITRPVLRARRIEPQQDLEANMATFIRLSIVGTLTVVVLGVYLRIRFAIRREDRSVGLVD